MKRPFVLLLLLISAWPSRADQPINYSNGNTNFNSYDTSGANDPTRLILSSGTATQNGGLSGTGAVQKEGLGTVILAGNNSYTGATTVSAGTLQLGGDFGFGGSLSSSTAISVASGATLAINLSSFASFSNAISNSGTVAGAQSFGNSSTIGGVISGPGGFTQTGAGKTILTGNNSYMGATSVAAGTLQIGDGIFGGSISSSSAVSVALGATLAINTSSFSTFANAISNGGTVAGAQSFGNSSTISGAISGSGGFTQVGASKTILTGNNSYMGATSVAAGTLQIGDGLSGSISSLSAVSVASGATLVINIGSLSSFFANAISNNGTVAAGTQFASNDFTLSGAIGGSGGFTQAGNGRTTLTGSNTYAGATSVAAGTLQIGNGTSGSIDSSSAVSVASGATLAINTSLLSPFASAITNNGTVTSIGSSKISGAISGFGGFTQNSFGTTTLTGTNTYSGATTVASGTLQIGDGVSGSISSTSTVAVASGATLAINTSSPSPFANTITNSGTVAGIGSSPSTISGAINGSGGFAQNGFGKTILSGSNTYTGATSVASGMLQIGNGSNGSINSLSAVSVASGATLVINTGSLPFANAITNNGTVAGGAQFDPTNLTISGVISGAGGFTQMANGKTILTGTNTYSGATSVASGTLQIGDNTNGSINASSAVSVAFGATLTLSLGANGTFANAIANAGTIEQRSSSSTISGVISGGGQFVQTNSSFSGTTTLTGNNTYSGGTSLSWGTLQIGSDNALGTGPITINGGNFRASGGTRTLSNAVTLGGSFTLGRFTNLAGPINLAFNASITSDNPDFGVPASSVLSGVISGGGGLTFTTGINPIGAIVLSGANTYTGDTRLFSGTLVLGNTLALQNSTFDSSGGTLQFDSITAAAFGGLKGSQGLVLRNNALAAVALTVGGSGDTTYSGVLSGVGSLIKTGTGTLELSGANTYTGGTTLGGGILEIGSDNAIPGGTITINGGNLRAAGDPRILANAVTVNGDFTLGRFTNLTGAVTLANSAIITSANPDSASVATSELSGVISGAFGLTFTAGANPIGAIVLSGANTYTGGTTISGGTLVAAHSGEIGTFQAGSTVTVNSGGTLQVNASDALGWGNGSAKLVVNGGTVTTDGSASQHTTLQDVTMTAGRLTDMEGNGHYFLNGPLVTNASAATAVIDAGLFEIGAGWVPGTTSLTVAQGAAPIDLEIASSLIGTSPLDKKGAGLLRLTGTSAFSGVTTVSAGTLIVDGSLANSPLTTIKSGGTLGGHGTVGAVTINSGGTISPGNAEGVPLSPGMLNTASETWSAGGNYAWEINKANGTKGADPGWDWLNISGTLTIAATSGSKFTIDITSLTLANAVGIAPNFVRGIPYSFTIATASGGISGFSTDKFLIDTSAFVNDPANIGMFAIVQVGNSLNLTYTAIPEPGTWAAGGLLILLSLAKRRRP